MRASERHEFECPVCHAATYVRLPFKLPDGSQKPGNFYRCTRCDFGFTDPPMFRKKKPIRAG